MRLATGAGGFGAVTNIATGLSPVDVAIGDVGRDGKLDVAVANNASSTVSVLLNTGARGVPGVSPATHGFGTQAQDTIGAAQPFELTATGNAALHVGRVRVVGTHADAFLIASDGCGEETILVGRSCTVRVRFAPAGPGSHGAQLQIADDGPGGVRTATLSGTGGALPQGPPGAPGPAGLGTPGPAGVGTTGPAARPARRAPRATAVPRARPRRSSAAAARGRACCAS